MSTTKDTKRAPRGRRNTLGARVRTLRARQGLTQDELARLLQVNRASIIRIEAGTVRTPRLAMVLGLCRALRTTPTELLRGA